VLAAIPAKVLLTGFLYYAMPLYLSFLSLSPGDRGRVMMGSGLAVVLLTPLVARLADAWGGRTLFVVTGTVLAAGAVLVAGLQGSPLLAVLGVLLLGAAQAIGVSPQLTLVMDVTRDDATHLGAGAVMGIFRLLERVGNVLGPIVVALLVGALGFVGAFQLLSVYVLVSGILFGLLWLFWRHSRHRLPPEPLGSATGRPT
jgi:MFS family permease